MTDSKRTHKIFLADQGRVPVPMDPLEYGHLCAYYDHFLAYQDDVSLTRLCQRAAVMVGTFNLMRFDEVCKLRYAWVRWILYVSPLGLRYVVEKHARPPHLDVSPTLIGYIVRPHVSLDVFDTGFASCSCLLMLSCWAGRRENVSMTEDLFGRLAFRINIQGKTKTSVTGSRHYLKGAPGLRGDARVDPVLGLAMFLLKRGDDDGYLFLDFQQAKAGSWVYDVTKQMKDAKFLEELREALDEAGVDSHRFLGTHPFKRGGVQLYRLLGVPDQKIKELGNWSTYSAYFAYVETSNRLEKRFTSTSPQAALADIIVRGGEVPECIVGDLDVDLHARSSGSS